MQQDRRLSSEEAGNRREEHGPNELTRETGPRPWRILADQFLEPLVLVLLAAAALSGLVWFLESDPAEPIPYDTVVILAIVVLNAVLGFVQEYRAEKAVESLKEMTSPRARVRRDGEETEIEAVELAPGDILLLSDGVRVPADARVLESTNLEAQEAALTGESVAVGNDPGALEDPELGMADRSNMVFMGSVITYGHGEAAVVATGMDTAMGGIADLTESIEKEETPLQEELARVGKQLGLLVLVVSALVAVIEIPTLQAAFDTVSPPARDWIFSIAVVSSVLLTVEALKLTPWVRQGAGARRKDAG